ncbi:MAG: site-specific integrase [Flavobacteriaceae bacterium]|nr:site-specific integrase [Flavobacteriaceae bacterium]
MHNLSFSGFQVPNTSHNILTGTYTSKVVIKKDYLKKDGTAHLYLQVFYNKKRVRLPTHIYVLPAHFDEAKERIRKRCKNHNDYNLMLEELKKQLHEIIVKYRLKGLILTPEKLSEEFKNPSASIDFCKFMEEMVERRKKSLAPGTFRHHKSKLAKLRKFKEQIYFSEIDEVFIEQFTGFLKVHYKNKRHTIISNLRTIKTYLNYARSSGIDFPLDLKKIDTPDVDCEINYLSIELLKKIERYYDSEFVPQTHRNVLQFFLFACYTGCRYSDIAVLNRNNFIDNTLVYVPVKTQKYNKMLRTELPQKALQYVNEKGDVFNKVYQNQVCNRYLKEIQKACGIPFKLTFHVSRHTFATLFLEVGGKVEVLQQLLLHSNIRETMRYVHILDNRRSEQIKLLDSL